LSRDGIAVVIHDDKVDRTTNGRGAVRDLTLAELKRLDAGIRFGERFAGERIPTLIEVFEATRGRCGLNVELKAPDVESAVLEIVSERKVADVLISSFDWDALRRTRKLSPDIPIGLLTEEDSATLMATAEELRAAAINPRWDIVNETLCGNAHRHRLKVYVWTVDKADSMKRMIECGVDGIMTNYPELLRTVYGK
jgi:glycerophosphoryl diester phosphodiesterase